MAAKKTNSPTRISVWAYLRRLIELAHNLFAALVYGGDIAHFFGTLLFGGAAAVTIQRLIRANLPEVLTGAEGTQVAFFASSAIVSLLFGAFFCYRYFIRARQLKSARRKLESVADNNERWTQLSYHYRDCDKRLFDLLFTHQVLGKMDVGTLVSAKEHLDANVDQILTYAVAIFSQLSGHRCAACIKIVRGDEEQSSMQELIVTTLKRDQLSRGARSPHDIHRVDRIRDNTADQFIFTPTSGGEFRQDVWANDNLKELFEKGKYVNARADWQDDYNATLVAGILNMRKPGKLHWIGMLCIDNRLGGLDNDMAKHYGRELSSRLSVLLYRGVYLEQIIDELRDSPGVIEIEGH